MITSTSPATGLLCRSIVPELVNVATPTKWPCNGPPTAIALLGFPSGRYCRKLTEGPAFRLSLRGASAFRC